MKKIKRIIRNILKKAVELFYKLFWLFPINNKKIVFSSFGARTFGDNPKYIALECIEELPDYELVYVLRNTNLELPKKIKKVKYNSFIYFYEMATSRVWIDNTRKESHIPKRKGQFYIQTWHGSLSLKKIEKDVEEKLDPQYVKTAKIDSKKIDLMITNSDWGQEFFKRCFWYDGKIVKCGSPRVDILFKDNTKLINTLRKKFNLSDEKILLYAPTFRESKRLDVYNIDYNRLIHTLEERFGSKWKIFVKLHPNISDKILNVPDFVINVTDYPDINELYTISDVMITDYSSGIFDFANLKRPIFLYAMDLEEYSNERDTYFNLKELPFTLSENNNQLMKNIKDFNKTDYEKKLDDFFKNVGLNENGNACKVIINFIKGE